MPGKGYSTIGVKPAVMERLQQITDKNYLGMFLPSTLIIMMNEVKAGRYTVQPHKLRLDLTGRYNTITIRSDIKEWLKSNYEENKEEYLELYNVKCFTSFVSYFIVNMIESKNDLENNAEVSIYSMHFGYVLCTRAGPFFRDPALCAAGFHSV